MAELNHTTIPEQIFCDRFCNQTNTFCHPRCYSLSSCSLVCLPIPPPPPPPPPPPRQSTKSEILSPLLIVVLAALAATLIIVFGYVLYIKYYWSRRRLPEPEGNETHDVFLDEDHGPVIDHPIWYIRTVGLQPSVISTIAVCKFKIGDGLVEGTECSVCLNEFQENETLRLLPKCNHAFHIPCIDTWLRSHTNCPMCRAPIIKNTDPNIQDSGAEATQMEILENHGESSEEIRENNLELRVGTEEEEAKEDMNGMQPMRRSVSLDSVSASKISLVLANIFPEKIEGNLDSQIVEVNVGIGLRRVGGNQSSRRFGASCSRGRGIQNASTSMKRSFSSSLLSRYSRSHSSGLPL